MREISALTTWKRKIRKLVFVQRIATAKMRMLPDFLIIGAQKCGTTSLYRYLIQHPSITRAYAKEVHYFDANFGKGAAWYRAHFACSLYRSYVVHTRGKNHCLTGEATPDYFVHPLVPQRVSELVPQARLILLLRNPVDRAYSHYHKLVRVNKVEDLSFADAIKQVEGLSFEEAMDAEAERKEGAWRKSFGREQYLAINHPRKGYLYYGMYVNHLQRWMGFFSSKQILILRSQDLFADPPATVTRVLRFLELPARELGDYSNRNPGNYPDMDSATRKRLIDYFGPHNQRLYDYLGVDFGWHR